MPKLLIVDDENKFRNNLAARFNLRGYETVDLSNGEDAVKLIRNDHEIDVVLLDIKMPGMDGEQALNEIKMFRPEIQVIMPTGCGTVESAMKTGRLNAFSYLEKPCDFDELINIVQEARENKIIAMEKHEIPRIERGSLWKWLLGSHQSRPGIIMLGVLIFAFIIIAPTPERMLFLLSSPKTGNMEDANLGYAGYRKMKSGDNITRYYSTQHGLNKNKVDKNGDVNLKILTPFQTAFRVKTMLGILIVAALFWATGAIPVGITALLVGVVMYFTGILRPDDIAKAYSKDAVVFIFGVLAMSSAISKTGLERRIGLLLLGPATTLPKLLFLFLPLLGMACSFVSEHALVAFIMPLFMMVYASSVRAAGIRQDRALAVMFVLSVCFAANCGGPGSPAAGGRNAVMMGILSDYGIAPTFGQWVKYGLPFVPVMAVVIALYFFIIFRGKIKVKSLNVSSLVKQASDKIGPMNRNEYLTSVVLIVLIILWVSASGKLG
ncbi:MAG: SLC13 family permease, partial [bacterium]